MPRILSKSGDSLADLYDIDGSIAGIDELQSKDVNLVHEMGSTIFSERLNVSIERLVTSAMSASSTFLVVLNTLPTGPWRVLGVNVFADQGSRVGDVIVAVHDDELGRDMPLFIWESTRDQEFLVRLRNDQPTTSSQLILRPSIANPVPTMGCGQDQRQSVNQLALQGTVLAFGAGTVKVTATVQIAFAERGGLSSRGLPLPGW